MWHPSYFSANTHEAVDSIVQQEAYIFPFQIMITYYRNLCRFVIVEKVFINQLIETKLRIYASLNTANFGSDIDL